MALSFNKVAKIITILSPDTEITIQNLLNSIREYEDELASMDIPRVVSCAGKEPLGGGVVVGLTLTLLDDWQLAFEARSGPTYIQCIVSGGNIVAENVNGSIYPTAFTQVLITASSSATQSELSAIQYASFGGAVHIDVLNGIAGTTYNIGTPENPSNNVPEAFSIANERGFEKAHAHGDLTLTTGDNVDGFAFMGDNPSKTTITIEAAASTVGCEFDECAIEGVLDGDTILEHCVVNNLSYVNGEIRNSRLAGPITLDGGANSLFLNCGGINPGVPPTINMGGTGQSAIFHDYSGGLKFENMTGVNDQIRIQLDGGKVVLLPTISAGKVTIVGVGLLVDSTGEAILSGTWNGVTIVNALVNVDTVAEATWEQTQKLKYRIESLRNGHVAFGNTLYWNPATGDDVNDGSTYALAVKTFVRAHDLVTSEHGDVIIVVGRVDHVITENIVITKNAVNVRGQGSGTQVVVASGTVVNVSGEHCSAEAIKIVGGDTGVIISGEGFKGVDLTVVNSTGNGVELSSSNVDLENIYCSGNGGNGVELKYGAVGCRIQKCGIRSNVNGININAGVIGTVLSGATSVSSNSNYGVNINPGAIGTIIYNGSIVHSNTVGDINDSGIGTVIKSTDESIADTVWSKDLSTHDTGAGRMQQLQTFDGYVRIDTVSGTVGTTFPIGTYEMPSNNLTDALTICSNNNIGRLRLRSSLTIEAGNDISDKSLETRGIMGTDVTLEAGCNASNTVFRYVNLQGTVSNGDVLLVENCSISNLTNFTGIMQDVTLLQGSEISINTWAEMYNCRAGGEPDNEPEINIGVGNLNIQQYRGNIKLTDKTGTDRTVVGCLSANVTIASSCVAGKIQILGLGEIEKDESGVGCRVDIDAAITNENIADAVHDENPADHMAASTYGLLDIQAAYKDTVYVDTAGGSAGTAYPIGLKDSPVNSLTDGLVIASVYKLNIIQFVAGIIFGNSSHNVSKFIVKGDGQFGDVLFIITDVGVDKTQFQHIKLMGSFTGENYLDRCDLVNTTNFNGSAYNCRFVGSVGLTGQVNFYNCVSYGYVHNFDLADSFFIFTQCKGEFIFNNKTSVDSCAVNMIAGKITIDSTCVAGTITIDGTCEVIDNSAAGCTVIDNTFTEESIADAVHDELISEHQIDGSLGYVLNETNEDLKRTLGLLDENSSLDQQVYDINHRLISARKRIYSNEASVGTDSDVLAIYIISATWSGQELISYKMVRS